MLGFKNVAEVNFGGKSPDPHMENMRAHMYARAKEWLLKGGIPADDEELCFDIRSACGFAEPEYHPQPKRGPNVYDRAQR